MVMLSIIVDPTSMSFNQRPIALCGNWTTYRTTLFTPIVDLILTKSFIV